ncbi:MAG: hypothetical protein LBS20_17540 [Prevotella sp.]|jgi:hypothetical protein|nr:hypothetical protein [Prevotella sp.]
MKVKSKTKTGNMRAKLEKNSGSKHRIPYYRIRDRAGTSSGPAPVRLYLNPILKENGSVDRKKIVRLFNTDGFYG